MSCAEPVAVVPMVNRPRSAQRHDPIAGGAAHLDPLIPPGPVLAVAPHVHVDALSSHVPVVDAECLSAESAEIRNALGQRQVHRTMAEPTLDTLFQALDHVYPRGQTQNGDGCFPSLCNVEEVVQQSLPRVCSKQIELVHDKDDRSRRYAFLRLRNLGRVREQGKQRGKRVGVVDGLLRSVRVPARFFVLPMRPTLLTRSSSTSISRPSWRHISLSASLSSVWMKPLSLTTWNSPL